MHGVLALVIVVIPNLKQIIKLFISPNFQFKILTSYDLYS